MCVKKMPQTANISAFTEVLTGFCENMTEAKILTFFGLVWGSTDTLFVFPIFSAFCKEQITVNIMR